MNELITAIKRKSLSVAKRLIDENEGINYQDSDGYTPLMWAIQTEQIEIVKSLLGNKNVNLELQDNWGQTALLFSIMYESPPRGLVLKIPPRDQIFNLILEAEKRRGIFNIERQNGSGETALILASKSGYFNIVNRLLEEGANVNHSDDDGLTALMMVSRRNHPDIVKILLQSGANVHLRDIDEFTALLHASVGEETRAVIEILLKADARVDDTDIIGRTPLRLAVSKPRNDESIELLLRAGANPNLQDNNGNTPLLNISFFKYLGYSEKVKRLINAGADPYIRDNSGISIYRYLPRSDISNYVMNYETEDPNLLTVDNVTNLMIAAQNGYLYKLEELLQNHPNINAVDSRGFTALHYAIGSNDEFEYVQAKKVKMLLDAGANLFINHEGILPTPYEYGIRSPNSMIVFLMKLYTEIPRDVIGLINVYLNHS